MRLAVLTSRGSSTHLSNEFCTVEGWARAFVDQATFLTNEELGPRLPILSRIYLTVGMSWGLQMSREPLDFQVKSTAAKHY